MIDKLKFDAPKVKNDIINWIRDFFERNGKGCNAIIGISGGKDSSVVAALCVEALGKDRVIGVLMPNGFTNKEISESMLVVEHLGIRMIGINIKCSYEGVLRDMGDIYIPERNGYETFEISKQTKINLAPRIRMAALYAVAQSLNGRVANTCNLSESFIGYSTRWGDSVGDFSPIGNLTTDEVVAIGLECGLPEDLVYKVPADGLCGMTDEENFGFSYEMLNKYIKTGTCSDKAVKEKIENLHSQNLFKLEPIPCFEF